MRSFAAGILFVLLCAFFASGEEAKPGLSVRLTTRVIPVKEKPEPLVIYAVELINTGDEEVTVLANMRDFSVGHDAADGRGNGEYQLIFGLSVQMKTKDGYPIIPSLTPFEPITLRKGECALVRLPQGDPGRMRAFDPEVLKNHKTAVVSYHVSESIGKRLGLWTGVVRTEKYPIRDGVIQANMPKVETKSSDQL